MTRLGIIVTPVSRTSDPKLEAVTFLKIDISILIPSKIYR